MFRFYDPVLFALERLWQHRTLVFWTLVGLAAATTLALSLTLYVDAVNTDLLTASLDDPPYAFRFRYLGSWEGRITPEDMQTASAVINQTFVDRIGLPAETVAQYTSAGSWQVTLVRDDVSPRLGAYTLGTLASTADLMRVVAGEWPAAASDGETIPVLISENMLYSMGVQVGDTLQVAVGSSVATLQVAALWQPVNEA
ncbi:MAG: hypothetical protein JW910_16810, partial [Anaerolineae bacterium]|nr:hypothetical protein [Anaerolineae bacterium]